MTLTSPHCFINLRKCKLYSFSLEWWTSEWDVFDSSFHGPALWSVYSEQRTKQWLDGLRTWAKSYVDDFADGWSRPWSTWLKGLTQWWHWWPYTLIFIGFAHLCESFGALSCYRLVRGYGFLSKLVTIKPNCIFSSTNLSHFLFYRWP